MKTKMINNVPLPEGCKILFEGKNYLKIERCSDYEKFIWQPVEELKRYNIYLYNKYGRDSNINTNAIARLYQKDEKNRDDIELDWKAVLDGNVHQMIECIKHYGGFYYPCIESSKWRSEFMKDYTAKQSRIAAIATYLYYKEKIKNGTIDDKD